MLIIHCRQTYVYNGSILVIVELFSWKFSAIDNIASKANNY